MDLKKSLFDKENHNITGTFALIGMFVSASFIFLCIIWLIEK